MEKPVRPRRRTELTIAPPGYQPSKADLQEEVAIPGLPREQARAAFMRPFRLERKERAPSFGSSGSWETVPISPFDGPLEADETFVGGKRKNMPLSKRKKLEGQGAVGKKAVVGVKDRKTKKVRAKVVENTDAMTLQGFVRRNVRQGFHHLHG